MKVMEINLCNYLPFGNLKMSFKLQRALRKANLKEFLSYDYKHYEFEDGNDDRCFERYSVEANGLPCSLTYRPFFRQYILRCDKTAVIFDWFELEEEY